MGDAPPAGGADMEGDHPRRPSWEPMKIADAAEAHDLECRIEALEIENARLQAALAEIAAMTMHGAMYGAGDLAQEALGLAA
jgi:hypothetical protein